MKKLLIILVCGVLTACGGGGGGSPAVPVVTAPVIPLPTVTISIDKTKIKIGETSRITWSSTNATSCSASGAWAGVQAISGISDQTPTKPGQQSFILSCTGVSGLTTQSVTLMVPITVQKSSYENKMEAANAIGPQPLPGEVLMSNAVAFGDFFQDGTYSMVTQTTNWLPSNKPVPNGTIHFYKFINSKWVDHTSDILSDKVGCLVPRKMIVSDFNGDGKPDVFIGCHGADIWPSPPGEYQRVLLSNDDGKYKNNIVPITCFCHGVSSADFNNNGFSDVLVADMNIEKRPYFLKNDGKGNFTKDFSRMDIGPVGDAPLNGLAGSGTIRFAQIFTVELIDFYHTGKYDAFVAGSEPIPNAATATTGEVMGNWSTSIMKNDGTNNYPTSGRLILPPDTFYNVVCDMVIVNGKMYIARVQDGDNVTTYTSTAIQKIDLATMKSEGDIYTHNTVYGIQPSPWINWINWIIPYQGNIRSLNTAYGVSVPL